MYNLSIASTSRADPEKFSDGIKLLVDPNTTKIGPSSARHQTFGSFVIFQGIRINVAKKPFIFVIFQGGGGGGAPVTPLDPHWHEL